jgi:hypothetical protein
MVRILVLLILVGCGSSKDKKADDTEAVPDTTATPAVSTTPSTTTAATNTSNTITCVLPYVDPSKGCLCATDHTDIKNSCLCSAGYRANDPTKVPAADNICVGTERLGMSLYWSQFDLSYTGVKPWVGKNKISTDIQAFLTKAESLKDSTEPTSVLFKHDVYATYEEYDIHEYLMGSFTYSITISVDSKGIVYRIYFSNGKPSEAKFYP